MGLARVIGSISTMGLIDPRSHGHRNMRYARQSRDELRKQTNLLQGKSINAGTPLGLLEDFNAKQAAKYGTDKPPKVIETLEKNPRSEINMWCMYAIATLFLLFATPYTLILTIPLGIYCFSLRQRAARNRTQRSYDNQVAYFDAMEAKTDVIPVTKPQGGRHARI